MKRKTKIHREWEALTGRPFDDVVAELYEAAGTVEQVAEKMEVPPQVVRYALSRKGVKYQLKDKLPPKIPGQVQTRYYAPDGRLIVQWLRDNNVKTVSPVTVIRRMRRGMDFISAVYTVNNQQTSSRRRYGKAGQAA